MVCYKELECGEEATAQGREKHELRGADLCQRSLTQTHSVDGSRNTQTLSFLQYPQLHQQAHRWGEGISEARAPLTLNCSSNLPSRILSFMLLLRTPFFSPSKYVAYGEKRKEWAPGFIEEFK